MSEVSASKANAVATLQYLRHVGIDQMYLDAGWTPPPEQSSMGSIDLLTRKTDTQSKGCYVFPPEEMLESLHRDMDAKIRAFVAELARETDGRIAAELVKLGWLRPCEGRRMLEGTVVHTGNGWNDWLELRDEKGQRIDPPYDSFEGSRVRLILDPLPEGVPMPKPAFRFCPLCGKELEQYRKGDFIYDAKFCSACKRRWWTHSIYDREPVRAALLGESLPEEAKSDA